MTEQNRDKRRDQSDRETIPSPIQTPLLTLRPPLSDQGDVVVLSDAWHRRRVQVKRLALLDWLTSVFTGTAPPTEFAAELEKRGLLNEEIDADSAKHILHWWQREWHPSLEYYLWSRKATYVDEHDVSGEHRRETLQHYLVQDAPPARLKPVGERCTFPTPTPPPENVTLGEVLMQRRTMRRYIPEPVTDQVFSSVLWFGLDEIRRVRQLPLDDVLNYLRSYGVAFDVYIVVYSIEGFAPGVYYYDLTQHSVVRIRCGDYRQHMNHILQEMGAPNTASWTIVFVADFAQYQWRYRHERALRNLYIEAGRLGQQLLLVGMSYGLGTLPTPATRDCDVSALLEIDQLRQAPIYTLTMGPYKKLSRG
jgi:SagB-type dehydrogenase family enzyme